MLEFFKTIFSILLLPQPEYTLFNTFLYAIEFVFASYLFFFFLKRTKIKIDKKFVVSFLPFALLGSSLRVCVDAGLIKTPLLVTPLIYLTIGSFFVLTLFFSLLLQKKFKVPYFKLVSYFCFLLISPIFLLLATRIVNLQAIALVFVFFSPWIVFLKIVKWGVGNKLVLLAHVFDANVTFIGMNYFGYREMHVLPNFFIGLFGPASFIFFKAIVVSLILILLDKISKKEEKNYLKLIVGFLGFSTGTRDFLRILLLV
jgi:uncharacterized membrane protein